MIEPDDLDELLRAVASRHRRRILFEVWGRERGAGELAELLELAPASVSEHLKVLRKHGLVTMRVDGTFRLYRAVPERLYQLAELLIQVFPAVDPSGESEEGQENAT
ncbi:ArsR/SmtB family transcription factor [Catenulispora sp. GP43]|uniref:ArsR/SmtB family transcription factor n=1 Tax=Catenulispora sp. GP43 TaxID=3156263 RepID=UPI00351826D5